MHVRRCDINLTTVVQKLRSEGVHNGTMFIASDSQQIIDEARNGGARPFVVSYLLIDRGRFETAKPTEKLDGARTRLNSLIEALMDITLLARSSLVIGKMMSNFPRLALQMRVQVPRLRLPGSYLALDDRPWCSRSSCREGFASAHEHELSTRRELWRNPPIPASFEF